MMPSNSTAKIQARRDPERRVEVGSSRQAGARCSRKPQLHYMRNFAHKQQAEGSKTGQEPAKNSQVGDMYRNFAHKPQLGIRSG
jgi:hypothetical protein